MHVNESRVHELLAPFSLNLSSDQVRQVLAYLELLLRWNTKMSLTAIRTPEDCITRHFAESLYLTRWIEPPERLLDIGSGAGFPGMALKIAWPTLPVTLLEPTGKKRAFLKEVARCCGFHEVDVRAERLEDFVLQLETPGYGAVTMRAVGKIEKFVPRAAKLLAPNGHLCLWISRAQAQSLERTRVPGLTWRAPIPVPLSEWREIKIGCLEQETR